MVNLEVIRLILITKMERERAYIKQVLKNEPKKIEALDAIYNRLKGVIYYK